MATSALAASKCESDHPQDKEHHGYNPQEVQRESQSSEEKDHQKCEY
jgi:hypothetical protein